jgi:hypothetical protein
MADVPQRNVFLRDESRRAARFSYSLFMDPLADIALRNGEFPAASMHHVIALIAKSDTLAARARQFDYAIVCPLVQSFSLLPITEALAKELAVHQSGTKAALTKPMPGFSDGLHALAIEISHDSPVAYITTTYFGGRGGQGALVWNKGSLRFSPATPGYDQNWPNSPISQALRVIGVVAEEGMDEFDTVGLGKHRETQQWAESAK